MLFKSIVPFVFLVASVNAAAIPNRRELEARQLPGGTSHAHPLHLRSSPFVYRRIGDDVLAGLASIAEQVIQDLPSSRKSLHLFPSLPHYIL